MWDAIYTPQDVALEMVGIVKGEPSLIADFAMGDGALLSAAQRKWPQAILIGTDIDHGALAKVRGTSGFVLGKCDFLNVNSRRSSSLVRSVQGLVNLVLLNPPFTCRGAAYRIHVSDKVTLRCSIALAFVLRAYQYLAPDGQMVAVLPSGCLSSEKDERAWNWLNQQGQVSIIKEYRRETFAGVKPNTVVVHIRSTPKAGKAEAVCSSETGQAKAVRIFRGRLPVFEAQVSPAGKYHFVHSTNLRNNLVLTREEMKVDAPFSITGPAVLICRVGKPDLKKIAVLSADQTVVLSDCIVVLSCGSAALAEDLFRQLLSDESNFIRLYSGTGAPYTTIKRLEAFISSLHQAALLSGRKR